MSKLYPLKKLSEICEIVIGGTPSRSQKSYWNNGEFLWVSIADMTSSGKFISQTKEKITEAGVKNSNVKLIPKGNLIFSFKLSIGKLAFVEQDLYTNEAIAGLIIKNEKELSREYLYYFMSQTTFSDATAAVKGKTLNKEKMKEIIIPLPPLSTQLNIVARLDSAMAEIDVLRAETESALASTRELWESTLESVFMSGEENWENKKLGEVATFRNGMNFTKGSKGEEIKIVGVRDFKNAFWVPFENLESVVIDGKLSEIDFLKENDILAVRSNGNPELIGRTLLAGKVTEKTSHSGFTIRIRLNEGILSSVYLCHFLKTQRSRKELVNSGTGINIKSLNQGALSSLEIPFPPLPEQSRIVAHLDAVRAETEKLEKLYTEKLASLDELKRSVLAEAFL